ncbi:MAG: hypothetical protein KJ065_18700 [Anaerolineae bacterium]|nr:hypothetical protein [Anaerolineae bacterium]
MTHAAHADDMTLTARTGVRGWLPPLVLAVGLMLLLLPVFTIETTETWDQGWHFDYAAQWYYTGQPPEIIPHIGYHLLLIGLKNLAPGLEFRDLAILVMIGVYACTGFMTYRYLLAGGWGVTAGRRWRAAGLSAALHLVGPVMLLTLLNQNMYFGYVTPHTYHNPTTIVLKPLALILFFISLYGLTHAHSPLWLMPLTLVISVASVMVKPNYALCLVPAVLLLMFVRLARRQPVDSVLLFLGLVAPTMITLAIQMEVMTTSRGDVVFAPLQSLTIYGETLLGQVVKLPLSLLFPLAVAGVTWRASKGDPAFQTAWLALGSGLAQYYLFNETKHPHGGNFWWGSQIALFILFIVSARIAWRAPLPEGRRRWLWVALALHVICGLIWWGLHVAQHQIGVYDGRVWW